MDKDELKDICDRAIELLKTEGDLLPTLLVTGLKGNMVVGLEFRDPEQKRAALELAGQKCAEVIPIAATFIATAWMSFTVPPDGKRVSEMPDRQECITIVYQHAVWLSISGPQTDCLVVPFTRMGKDILLGETIETGEFLKIEASLLSYFWRGAARELMKIVENNPNMKNN